MNTSVPTQNVCYIDFENNKFSVSNSANQKAAKVFDTKFEAEEYAKVYAKRRKLQIFDLTNKPTFAQVPAVVEVIDTKLIVPPVIVEEPKDKLPIAEIPVVSESETCGCNGNCGCAGGSVVFSPEIVWPVKETLFDKIKKFFLNLIK
jgi:hypothetical protein